MADDNQDATTVDGRRRYDSRRRTAQAEETRAEIVDAARRLFVAQGWAGTTMRAVADEAGVSTPTVYAGYKNRAGLVRALAEAADLAADAPTTLAAINAAASDPARQIAALVAYDRRLFEQAGDVIIVIREAGRSEPDLAPLYGDLRRHADETRTRLFASWPPGVIRSGVSVPTAVDIYAAMCNIDVYTTLAEERGWSPDRVERWWSESLRRELLAGPR